MLRDWRVLFRDQDVEVEIEVVRVRHCRTLRTVKQRGTQGCRKDVFEVDKIRCSHQGKTMRSLQPG